MIFLRMYSKIKKLNLTFIVLSLCFNINSATNSAEITNTQKINNSLIKKPNQNKNNNKKSKKKKKKIIIDPKVKDPLPPIVGGEPTINSILGSLAGAGVGAGAGLAAGATALLGTDAYTAIPYTVIGSFAGSAIGSFAGSGVGSLAGAPVGAGIGVAASSLQGIFSGIASSLIISEGLASAGYNFGNALN